MQSHCIHPRECLIARKAIAVLADSLQTCLNHADRNEMPIAIQTPHNVNNVQMGDDEMPSRGKKVSIVQHEHQKLFWRHISGSNNIKF